MLSRKAVQSAEADAFVLVGGFGPDFAPEDEGLAEAALRSGRKVFVVLNKVDEVPPAERTRAVEKAIARFSVLSLKSGKTVFSVSARDGLRGRLSGDGDKLRASGIPAFETALLERLLEDKRHDFIVSMSERIEAVLEGDAVAERAALASIRERASELRAESSGLTENSFQGEATPLQPCVICARVENAVFEHLTRLQADLREKADLRAEFVQGGGLCGPHARQLARVTAPREICTALSPVLLERAKRIRALAARERDFDALAACHPGRQGCSGCLRQQEVLVAARDKLLAELCGPFGDRSAASGLCLPHAIEIAAEIDDCECRKAVMAKLATDAERLVEDMRRFATKQDASRRDQMSKEERTAWARGLELLVGRENADPRPRSQNPQDPPS